MKILESYNRNIIVYITEIISNFNDKDDLLIRVACGLYLLTCQENKIRINSNDIKEILNDKDKFEQTLERFKRTSTKGKKRLWCCIRDYKKGVYNKIFNGALVEVAGKNREELIDIWNKLPMNQLELPGDVWNSSMLFRHKLFSDVFDVENVSATHGMPQIIRDLYNQIKQVKGSEDLYPEQFDVTFDFVPRMCEKRQCKVCLFGGNAVDLICTSMKDKYCPVSLFSCGYLYKCKGSEEHCVIREGISKGICKTNQ